ncbi:hypothetical protein DFJ74DRAFT_112479 [Hyaloraphidium curvatum]|nr:hypothetical protein DFJ74DRAFT_112479 [Hyaloraphidium curvatum]
MDDLNPKKGFLSIVLFSPFSVLEGMGGSRGPKRGRGPKSVRPQHQTRIGSLEKGHGPSVRAEKCRKRAPPRWKQAGIVLRVGEGGRRRASDPPAPAAHRAQAAHRTTPPAVPTAARDISARFGGRGGPSGALRRPPTRLSPPRLPVPHYQCISPRRFLRQMHPFGCPVLQPAPAGLPSGPRREMNGWRNCPRRPIGREGERSEGRGGNNVPSAPSESASVRAPM